MPRVNRRRDGATPLDLARASSGMPAQQWYASSTWAVRRVGSSTSERTYLCPGCQQDLSAATAHVVVWPADGVGGVGDRRHWHARCWSERERRRPGGSYR